MEKGKGMHAVKERDSNLTLSPKEREFLTLLESYRMDSWGNHFPETLARELKARVYEQEFKRVSNEEFEIALKGFGLSSADGNLEGKIINRDGKKIKILSARIQYFPLLKKGVVSLIVREL